MRLEWIDDILAVLDCGSLARAAEKRLLTQSAFTRRVRLIEDSIGVTLFDRRRKPVVLLPGVHALEPELRDLSARLHDLRQAIKTSSRAPRKSLAFVCQHALTTTLSPRIVRALSEKFAASVQVRSGNQDECLMQLISKEVDFAVMYALSDESTPEPASAFQGVTIGKDMFVPVCSPNFAAGFSGEFIPTITYPSEVFLGQVFAQKIRPQILSDLTISSVAETALTIAMLQLVLTEIGCAWLPRSLIADHITQGRLVEMCDVLPSQPLTIRLVRLSGPQTQNAEHAWHHLTRNLRDAV
jgi:DNA-binding transcriptional LysR family regulator